VFSAAIQFRAAIPELSMEAGPSSACPRSADVAALQIHVFLESADLAEEPCSVTTHPLETRRRGVGGWPWGLTSWQAWPAPNPTRSCGWCPYASDQEA